MILSYDRMIGDIARLMRDILLKWKNNKSGILTKEMDVQLKPRFHVLKRKK